MILSIISFILDLVLNSFILNAYQNINLFFPCLFVISIPFQYTIIKNKKRFLLLLLISGIIYDILYSDIFLINTYFFILYGLLIEKIIKKDSSIIKLVLLSIIGIVIYDIFIFFILVLINYSNYHIELLYYKIKNTIVLNLMYSIIIVLILKSRLLYSKKKKKRKRKNILLFR